MNNVILKTNKLCKSFKSGTQEQQVLKNLDIEFYEGDFIALAQTDMPWPSCDYVIAHGILSWINFEVRHALFRMVDRSLTPGGLAYFSYNALPGWPPIRCSTSCASTPTGRVSMPSHLKVP